MQITMTTEFKALVKDGRGRLVAVIYSEQMAKLLEHAEEMKAALLAANEAWDSGFSDKRHEARAKVQAALATVAP